MLTSRNYSAYYSLTHSLTHSLARSLTHSLMLYRVMPGRATLWCRPLRCNELWRRRHGRLGNVEGVNLDEFNSFRPRGPQKKGEALVSMVVCVCVCV